MHLCTYNTYAVLPRDWPVGFHASAVRVRYPTNMRAMYVARLRAYGFVRMYGRLRSAGESKGVGQAGERLAEFQC